METSENNMSKEKSTKEIAESNGDNTKVVEKTVVEEEREEDVKREAESEEEIEEVFEKHDEEPEQVTIQIIQESTKDRLDEGDGSKLLEKEQTNVVSKSLVMTSNTTVEGSTTTTTVITPTTPTNEKKYTDNDITKNIEEIENENKECVVEQKEEEEQVEKKEEDQVKEEEQDNEEEIGEAENTTEVELVQKSQLKQETAVDSPSVGTDSSIHNKQENLNNVIKDIISNIDSNISAEENIAALKEKEFELLRKQEQLTREIQQQQLLAQKLANENQLKQQQLNNSFTYERKTIPSRSCQPISNVSKYSSYERQHENIYSPRTETFMKAETANESKKIDLHKIFTPATDAEEILPKTRKLYASSAFYSPALHPTVEDQVELARRISHSLSDISNHQSRGQSMYVNRKKRSVKWVHEGNGQDFHQYQQPKSATSPSILPAYTDAAKHRVQLNLHQEQILEKYAKPGLKVVQTPWEAALNSGSASTAFVEEQKFSQYDTPNLTPSPTPQILEINSSASTSHDSYVKPYSADDYQKYPANIRKPQHVQPERQVLSGNHLQRELAYKPSIPQGWKAPGMSLPKDLYMPKEIPLQSYAPPPVAATPSFFSNNVYNSNQRNSSVPLTTPASFATTESSNKAYGGSTFKKSNQHELSTSNDINHLQRQHYLPPQIYQKVPKSTSQTISQVNFNPSPLPYDKLAKFENQPVDDSNHYNSRTSHLSVRGNKIRNTSPTPYCRTYCRPCTPSSETFNYGSTSMSSPSLYNCNGHNIQSPYVTATSNQIMNAPSYNNSARGWGCSDGMAISYPFSHSGGGSILYTDF